jgi:hypothetical protein
MVTLVNVASAPPQVHTETNVHVMNVLFLVTELLVSAVPVVGAS